MVLLFAALLVLGHQLEHFISDSTVGVSPVESEVDLLVLVELLKELDEFSDRHGLSYLIQSVTFPKCVNYYGHFFHISFSDFAGSVPGFPVCILYLNIKYLILMFKKLREKGFPFSF